jgi:hypothetical protein
LAHVRPPRVRAPKLRRDSAPLLDHAL